MSCKRQRPAPAAGTGPSDVRHELHAAVPADAARSSSVYVASWRSKGQGTGARRPSPTTEEQAASGENSRRQPLPAPGTASSPEDDIRRWTPRKRPLAEIDTSGDTFPGSGSDTHTTPEQGVAFPARETAASHPQEDGNDNEHHPAYLPGTVAGDAPSHSRSEGMLSVCFSCMRLLTLSLSSYRKAIGARAARGLAS